MAEIGNDSLSLLNEREIVKLIAVHADSILFSETLTGYDVLVDFEVVLTNILEIP